MRKVFLFLLTFVAMVAEAQTKGNFEVLDLGSFKLHVYNTNDALEEAEKCKKTNLEMLAKYKINI